MNPHPSASCFKARAFSLLLLIPSVALAAETAGSEPARENENAPPPSVATWVAQDRLDPPEQGSLVFIGSSSIRRWDSLARDFADYKVIQRGYGGALLAEMPAAIPWVVVSYHPSAVVLWGGTNDLTAGHSGEVIHGDFVKFLQTLRKDLPDVPLFYLGMTPTPANGRFKPQRLIANALIQETISKDANCHYIDLPAFFDKLSPSELEDIYVDPVHLNRAGYAEWIKLVRPRIEALLKPNKPAFASTSAPAAGDRLLFDFGPDNDGVDGHSTTGADANGHHWNNWFKLRGGAGINSGEHKSGVIKADGSPTGVKWIITGGYSANGRKTGGLFAPHGPDPALLGDLAVESATEDYFYSTADDQDGGGDDDRPGGFMLTGLDPSLSYEFRFFASRENDAVRRTEYAVYGADRRAAEVQTSGKGIGGRGSYDGNDSKVAVVSGVRPDAFGQVFIDMLALEGGFAYINALEIIVSRPGPAR